MKRLFVCVLSVALFSCQTPADKNPKKDLVQNSHEFTQEQHLDDKVNPEFWNRLTTLKGKTFEGEVIEAPEGDDFRGKELVMHVLDVKQDTIYIPFNVGDNKSRTWVLTKSNQGIQLKHDHRKKDGSNDEITMYGGMTPNTGYEGLAIFPADQETVDLLPRTATNVWWITVDDTKFTYNLRRIGSTTQFSIGFDLERPVQTPDRSWGWEDYKF